MTQIANTPQPPYYAVIAPAELSKDVRGYPEMVSELLRLATEQPGFLGIEACMMNDFALAVSYWESLDAIAGWRKNARHVIAKDAARKRWFSRYLTRIARVEVVY